jgi:mxaA protein
VRGRSAAATVLLAWGLGWAAALPATAQPAAVAPAGQAVAKPTPQASATATISAAEGGAVEPGDAAASAGGTAAATAGDTAAQPASVEQPRSFGHLIGDVLTQRVLLEHGGHALSLAALPVADRVGLWLERRAARVEPDVRGRDWLVLDYQVVNAPRALTSVPLPALELVMTSGVTLAVPAWPLSIGPLTPGTVFGQGDLQPLRPDRPVAALATEGLQRQFVAAAAALGAVLIAWLGWWAWRNSREAERLPFARASGELRQLARMHRGQPLAAVPEAWRVMHRALNASAGRVVHAGSLPRLLVEAPHLQPLAARLEVFYRQSAAHFFALASPANSAAGSTVGAPAASAVPEDLLALCRDLRQAEQRHAK